MEVKNKAKKPVRKKQQQQHVAAAAGTQDVQTVQASAEVQAGRSLRWDQPLSHADVLQTRQVLSRIGLNADVADAVAPGLHPAECWALWLYARACKLRPAWIASQLYDGRTKKPRMPGIPAPFEAAGRMLLELPPAIAELVIDITDRNCPDQAEARWIDLRADARYTPDGPDVEPALRAAWEAMCLERGQSSALAQQSRARSDRAMIGDLPPVEPRWAAVQAELRLALTPNDYTTWIEPVELIDVIGEMVVLGAPNLFVRGEIGGAFAAPLASALHNVFGRPMRVEVVIASAQGA